MSLPTGSEAISNAKLWASLSLDTATLLSAKFLSSTSQVLALWSQRDVVASRKRVFSTTYTLSCDDVFVSSPPMEVQDPSYPNCFFSPSRKKFLKFTAVKSGGADAEIASIILEVWTVGAGLHCCWEIDPDTHGPVFTDEWFGAVAWAPDETMVAYVADCPKKSQSGKSEDPQEAWALPLLHKFQENARDPFGEAYVNRRSPTLFIADIASCRSTCVFDAFTSKGQAFLGEPQWSPDGKYIAATMRRSPYVDPNCTLPDDHFFPSDLGLRYCYNRHSAIVIFRAPQSAETLKPTQLHMHVVSSENDVEDFCCNSPRFSPDGNNIIYLSAPKFSSHQSGRVLPHNTTKVLRTVQISNLEQAVPKTLIAVPEDPGHADFPGLYLHSLPEDPWVDTNSIVFSSAWGSINKPLLAIFTRGNGCLVPIPNSPVKDLAHSMLGRKSGSGSGRDMRFFTTTVLDKLDGTVLIAASDPASPTQLFTFQVGNGNCSGKLLHPVSFLSGRSEKLQSFLREAHTVDLVTTRSSGKLFDGCAAKFLAGKDEPSTRYQITILLPKGDRREAPLIVYPHGGPHVCTLNGYSQGAMALLRRGFAVMYVNYRGSLGLGQKSLETLPGNVGTQEVNEVVQATRWAIQQEMFGLDGNRVGFLGGSHSGFIGAHTSLIPGLYKRTVLRNPVVNIATMVGASDIPDWCFCEAGVDSKNKNGVHFAADADQLRMMYERSPVSKVKECQASERPGPTLLQVGGSDRRVPPQQSLEWKRMMVQAYGTESTIVRWYPNSGHAIDEVPNGDDAWVQALDFLCKI